MSARYFVGADLPDLAIRWKDRSGNPIDFSSGYSFQLKVTRLGQTTALFTKNTGFTGAAMDPTAPNLTVAWATTGELNNLAAGPYTVHITATRTADSKERKMQGRLEIYPSVV